MTEIYELNSGKRVQIKPADGESKKALIAQAFWYLELYLQGRDDDLFNNDELSFIFKEPEDRVNVQEYVDVKINASWWSGQECDAHHAFNFRVFALNHPDGTSSWHMLNKGEFDIEQHEGEEDVLHITVGLADFRIKPLEY